jgi:hypothetical protein
VRRLGPAALLAVLAAALAGCGRSHAPFSVTGTTPCLKKNAFRVSTSSRAVGFIARTAPRGSLRAFTTGDANVTISFADDAAGAANIMRAYHRFAPRKLRRHLGDILDTNRNAVLLWSVAPTPEQLNTAMGCLHP